MPDVILTGMPRSGLTVVAALMDTLPGVVCLNEPRWQESRARNTQQAMPFCKWLVGDFAWRRMQLRRQIPLWDWRAADGKPLLDTQKDAGLPRDAGGEPQLVQFTRPGLGADFTLAMKHHTLYSALLPQLAQFEHFRIMAVIRHPFDVIRSWRGIAPLFLEKHMELAGKFWPELPRIMQLSNEAERMVQLYEAFAQRYYELRETIEIMRFEDVIANPSVISEMYDIKTVSPAAKRIEHRPRVLLREETAQLQEPFKRYGVFTRQFYDV